MRPKLELLDKPLIERILDEAFQLIEDPGVRAAPYVEDLLRAAGITVKMESGISAVLGALAGINMISGAGMLDFLACHSIEKMVIDAEAIVSAQRLIEGIQPRCISLALDMFAQTGLQGDFLKLKATRALFRKEQHFPSAVIDRGLPCPNGLSPDIVQRARQRVGDLISSYERSPMPSAAEQELLAFAQRETKPTGLDGLPGILNPDLPTNRGRWVWEGTASAMSNELTSVHDHGGLAGDLEPLAAAHVLAGHHVVFTHHVRPELGETGPVAFIGASGKLALLGTHYPGHFVVGRLMTMWAIQ